MGFFPQDPSKPISPGPKNIYTERENPEKDAWHIAFFIENHLDYNSYPGQVATPEQVRFMVYTEEEECYYPCSDKMFESIINRNNQNFVNEKYNAVLERIFHVVDEQIEDENENNFLKSLIKIKFMHETRDAIMLPSRLEKRLLRIFINHSNISDPYLCEKAFRNNSTKIIIKSECCKKALDIIYPSYFKDIPDTISNIRKLADYLELKRLFTLSVENSLWTSAKSAGYAEEDFLKIFERKFTGNGADLLFDLICKKNSDSGQEVRKKILWLIDEAGEAVVDITIVNYLVKLGHKIILVFKEGPLFTKTTFYDAMMDEAFAEDLKGAYFIKDSNLGKNDLIRIIRSDNDIMAISDGIFENVNLLLTSTTFARFFKEADFIISRGYDQKRRFFDTHFQFTQDIFNISAGENDSVNISYKPKHPLVIKFSYENLERKAKSIINQMSEAKKKGMTVIFYSGIIGSIPGKIKMAKRIMSIFIQHLRERFAMTFIINPSEYYETGMDADDLMYMWEIVQTSGLIDIWRFQSYEDIVEAFQIMGRKVPPEWVGKDATFSTGCTKEMKIAGEVLEKHPEMQIIGPPKEKFMRRNEYGVGKMYDQRLGDICNF
ncbi:ARMT1-like domain-containing protein [Desulfobacterium sp. N47]|uniref:ARMT1-like domain-containing protein n=1 Tax=Desulfobacterium sp. N47 TaxID=3115210 RepID=UPI003CAB4ECE